MSPMLPGTGKNPLGGVYAAAFDKKAIADTLTNQAVLEAGT